MKKIIRGKRFDTDSAHRIGSDCSSLPANDFGYWDVSLYVSPRSKSYFIAGSGGPMTRFAQSAGQNQWTGGSDLIPMTREEAFAWAQEHLTTEEIEKEFSDLIEET